MDRGLLSQVLNVNLGDPKSMPSRPLWSKRIHSAAGLGLLHFFLSITVVLKF